MPLISEGCEGLSNTSHEQNSADLWLHPEVHLVMLVASCTSPPTKLVKNWCKKGHLVFFHAFLMVKSLKVFKDLCEVQAKKVLCGASNNKFQRSTFATPDGVPPLRLQGEFAENSSKISSENIWKARRTVERGYLEVPNNSWYQNTLLVIGTCTWWLFGDGDHHEPRSTISNLNLQAKRSLPTFVTMKLRPDQTFTPCVWCSRLNSTALEVNVFWNILLLHAAAQDGILSALGGHGKLWLSTLQGAFPHASHPWL